MKLLKKGKMEKFEQQDVRSEEILKNTDHTIFHEYLYIKAFYTTMPFDCYKTNVHNYEHALYVRIDVVKM